MVKFQSTRSYNKSLKSAGSTKAAGANVKGSRLNASGDVGWRGKRGGEKKASKKGMSYGGGKGY